MNLRELTLAGPYTHENLSIFLLSGRDAFDGSNLVPLQEALARKWVTVHETGEVGQLEVENRSNFFDLYIQAGDVVKGGRQDRTLGVDFVLPAGMGRTRIPSFCVEKGRWQRRAAEEVQAFASAPSSLASKELRLAAKLSRDQGEVWQKVAEAQQKLSATLDKSMHATASPTSYQLSLEDEDLQKQQEAYRAALAGIIEEKPEVLGYVFLINGEINTADVYGSGALFRKLWGKLLDAAALEAIGERQRKAKGGQKPMTADDVQRWFADAETAAVSEMQEVPPRVRVETRRGEKLVGFDTRDRGFGDAVLHRNLVAC